MAGVFRHPQFTGLISTSPNKNGGLTHTASLQPVRLPAVVGYSTQEIAGGNLSCVAIQFSDVGTDGQFSIANFKTEGLSAGAYDTMSTDAPCIMFYNGVGYDYFFYISDAYNAAGDEVTAWADTNGDAVEDVKSVGEGCWLRIPEGTCVTGTITEAGEVATVSTSSIELSAGLTLAGNPYPTAMNMSKISTKGLTAGSYDTMSTDAPCIMFYNGVGYDYYFYIADAYNSAGDEVTAWADTNGDAVDGEIAEVGKAFWARTTEAGILTFSL